MVSRNDVSTYYIVFGVIALGAYDFHRYAVRKMGDAYNRYCDSVNNAVRGITGSYILGLQSLNLAPSPPRFTRFINLPAEIRTLIWHFATDDRRVIELRRTKSLMLWGNHRSLDDRDDGIFTIAPVPSLLHTSHEARLEALKVYTLAFGTDLAEPMIYVNFDRDFVYFGSACEVYFVVGGDASRSVGQYQLGAVRMDDLDKIQWLALRVKQSWGPTVSTLDQQRWQSLKEIVVVSQKGTKTNFGLGPKPNLCIEGEAGGENVAWDAVNKGCTELRTKIEERIMGWNGGQGRKSGRMSLRDGTFVKGPEDTWWCSEGRWP